jgi:hypothetical protein
MPSLSWSQLKEFIFVPDEWWFARIVLIHYPPDEYVISFDFT